MARYSLFELISGYTHSSDIDDGKRFVGKTITGSFAGRQNNRKIRMVMRMTARLKEIIAYTSTRAYGLFLLSFGLTSVFAHFAKDYVGVKSAVPLYILIVGVISAMLGVFVVIFDKPLTVFLQDFKLTDFVLYEFFCIKRTHKGLNVRGIPWFVGLILGVLLAVAALFLRFLPVVITVLAIVYVYVAFLSPEFSLFSTFLVLPYLSMLPNHELLLAAFVSVNALTFARKVMLGKRIFYLEQYDVLLSVFLLFVLISGIFVKGVESFHNSIVMMVLALGYPLSSCIIANRRLADCLIKALILSSVPVSIMSLVQFIIFIIGTPVSSFRGVQATFSSPDVLAVFLLLSFVFSLYMLKAGGSPSARLLYLLISALTFLALSATLNLWAIGVALLAWPVYFLLRSVRPFIIVVILIALTPSLFIFLPDAFWQKIVDLQWLLPFNISDVVLRWKYAKEMFLGNVFLGIGIGSDCFVMEFEALTGLAAEFTNAGHFILEIAIEAGVFAPVVLLLILFVRIRHTGLYLSYTRNSHLSLLSPFNTLALSALLMLGAVNYLWADMSMYFLFWCLFGIGTATLRISRQEHDDRMGYYSDGRSSDSSSIDVVIQ